MQLTAQTAKTTALAPAAMTLRQPVLQRKCGCGQHTSSGECEECKKRKSDEKSSGDPLLQRSALNHTAIHGVPPIVHEVLRSSGQPLDAATQAYFEPRLGQDFSKVRVHADAKAAESARAVNALAYTLATTWSFGTEVWFLIRPKLVRRWPTSWFT